jgi:glycopeptide antibiotics resistance protein
MIMVPSRQFAVVNMQNAQAMLVQLVPFKVLYDYLKVGVDEQVDMEKK